MPNIGCVGLGHLGVSLAANLIRAGFTTHGFRRSSLAEFEAMGGHPAPSPCEVASRSDVVITCLPSAEALVSVFRGPGGVLEGMRSGQVVIDVTTAPIAVKEDLRRAVEDRGGQLLDAPVSGRPAQVERREAVIFVSGQRDVADQSQHVFAALSQHHPYCGSFGNGTRLKFVANMLLTIHTLATAEAANIAAQVGIGPDLLLDALSNTPAASEVLRRRLPILATGQTEVPPASSEMIYQDLRTIDAFITASSAPTPLFSTVLSCFEQALGAGHGGQDTVLTFAGYLRQLTHAKSAEPE